MTTHNVVDTPWHAVILAGGKGTRLKPFTDHLPKPLIPLGKIPILELIIRQLKGYGFQQVTLCVGHMAELIHAHFGNGDDFGLPIHYTFEDSPLGTAGPLAFLSALPEHFLVMNADLVTDLNFKLLMEEHIQHQSMATLATFQRTTQIEFGVLDFVNNTQDISGFREKPTLVHSVCMGIHALHRDVLRYIPVGEFCGIDTLVSRLMNDGHRVRAYKFDGYWLDIGRHTDYETAQRDFEQMRHRLLPQEGTHKGPLKKASPPKVLYKTKDSKISNASRRAINKTVSAVEG